MQPQACIRSLADAFHDTTVQQCVCVPRSILWVATCRSLQMPLRLMPRLQQECPSLHCVVCHWYAADMCGICIQPCLWSVKAHAHGAATCILKVSNTTPKFAHACLVTFRLSKTLLMSKDTRPPVLRLPLLVRVMFCICHYSDKHAHAV